MKFKTYDILSSLVPGFLILLVLINLLEFEYNKELIIPYTAIAFLVGYIINTLSSWFEDFYFWTWGAKPSDALLNGNDIWKVRFYHSKKVKKLLLNEADTINAKNDELFSIAMRYANGSKESRVDDFNGMYAFARTLLTSVIIGTISLIATHYCDWRYYVVLIPIFFIVWLRAKQRGYYYAREVLNVYLKLKELSD